MAKNVLFNLLRLFDELLCNILYKLTVSLPKTRSEFIKDAIDSVASDYKEIEAFSVASSKDIYCIFTWEKRIDCIVCSDRNNPAIGCKRSEDSMHMIKVSMPIVL